MPRANRLMQLMQVLRRYRRPVSAQSLAEQLSVSKRSIYRDVQTLRQEGALIDGEAGAGYLLRPGFLLPPLMFADEELEALVLGLRLTREHGDAELGRAAADALAKLRAVLPKELRALVDDTSLLAGPARARVPERIDLAAVRRSIRLQHKLELDYVDQRGTTSRRVVWPIGIGFFERARVIIAWCEQRADFRSFRADRVADMRVLPARFPRPRAVLLRQWAAREGIAAQLPG